MPRTRRAGEPSRTCASSRNAGNRSLLEVSIETGRPHQIRIHLAWAGHPLVGDPLYGVGGVPLPQPGLPGDPGYRLHAHRLSLTHPATGDPLTLECAAPADLTYDGDRGA